MAMYVSEILHWLLAPQHARCPFQQGVCVQSAMTQLFLVFEQPQRETDLPRAKMLRSVPAALSQKADLLPAVGYTFLSLIREGVPLCVDSVISLSRCLPAPAGLCSSQTDLEGKKPEVVIPLSQQILVIHSMHLLFKRLIGDSVCWNYLI